MLILHHHTLLGIDKIESQTTELRTSATVGTATETVLRSVTPATIAHAQRTMHKSLETRRGHSLVNILNLAQRKFARKNHLLESRTIEKIDLFGRTIIHLRARVQGNGRNIHARNSHILNNKSIHTRIVQLSNERFNLGKFVIIENSVQCYINFDTENMSILHQTGNILDGITRSLTCPETRSTNIHSIGTMIDGIYCRLVIACRSKQFYFSGSFKHDKYIFSAKITQLKIFSA